MASYDQSIHFFYQIVGLPRPARAARALDGGLCMNSVNLQWLEEYQYQHGYQWLPFQYQHMY